jgi:hypothetical protein
MSSSSSEPSSSIAALLSSCTTQVRDLYQEQVEQYLVLFALDFDVLNAIRREDEQQRYYEKCQMETTALKQKGASPDKIASSARYERQAQDSLTRITARRPTEV